MGTYLPLRDPLSNVPQMYQKLSLKLLVYLACLSELTLLTENRLRLTTTNALKIAAQTV